MIGRVTHYIPDDASIIMLIVLVRVLGRMAVYRVRRRVDEEVMRCYIKKEK